jgi:hypothetical protein
MTCPLPSGMDEPSLLGAHLVSPEPEAFLATGEAAIKQLPTLVGMMVVNRLEGDLRRKPRSGDWSAIEIVGHLCDKMTIWRDRFIRTVSEDSPFLESYDQDLMVRQHGYQTAQLADVLAKLRLACESFASTISSGRPADLDKCGRHSDFGRISAADCIRIPIEAAKDHLAQIGRVLTTDIDQSAT